MREIKFRGYNEICGWVYGLLQKENYTNRYYINDFQDVDGFAYVEEDSIGQYTGFKDKNDKEIYEGDIIKTENDEELCQVIFDEYSGMWKLRDLNTYMGCKFSWYKCEVIGNIYEDKLKEK